MSENHEHHTLSIKTATLILITLLIFTVITVLTARIDLGFFNIIVALGLATTKSMFVIMFFMHLKYENRMMKLFVFICFLILAIFIGLTFLDVAYR